VSIGKGDRVSQNRISGNAIGEIVKRYAAAAGFDPKMFAGHSLRAGFVTSALEHGADVLKVMDVTRHRRVETLRGYDRRAKAFRNHAGDGFL
jgi:site-specific recombinase XerD